MLARILLSLPLWLTYTAIELVLNAVGLVLLLPMSLAQAWYVRRSRIWPNGFQSMRHVDVWKGGWLTWVWGNEEDGVSGPTWWWRRHPDWPIWRLAYVWSALRNPTNNLRFIPGINPVIDPKRVRADFAGGWGSWAATYTWQGVFSGLHVTFRVRDTIWRFWWGWKLKPEDRRGVDDSDMRKPRCGFAIQLKRIN